jgi:hypothetical protein
MPEGVVSQHRVGAGGHERTAGQTKAAQTSALLPSANAGSVYPLSASRAAAASALTDWQWAMARAAG